MPSLILQKSLKKKTQLEDARLCGFWALTNAYALSGIDYIYYRGYLL